MYIYKFKLGCTIKHLQLQQYDALPSINYINIISITEDNFVIYILKLLTCTCGTVIICCGLRLSKLCLWAKTLATSWPSFSRICSECRSLLLRGPNDPRCCRDGGTEWCLSLRIWSLLSNLSAKINKSFVKS